MATPGRRGGFDGHPYILRSNMLGRRGGFFAVPFCLQNRCACNGKGQRRGGDRNLDPKKVFIYFLEIKLRYGTKSTSIRF